MNEQKQLMEKVKIKQFILYTLPVPFVNENLQKKKNSLSAYELQTQCKQNNRRKFNSYTKLRQYLHSFQYKDECMWFFRWLYEIIF